MAPDDIAAIAAPGALAGPARGPGHARPHRARAARPLPPPRQAMERAPEVHLHFRGVTAEDVAAILQDSPGVNLDGQQRVTWAWPRQDG